MAMMQKSKKQSAVEMNNDVDSMPIAASGFWAKGNVLIDCVVPKISGVGCASVKKAPKSGEQPNCRLMAAKTQAEVGENIRWDIISQEADKFPCHLKDVKPNRSDSDDAMSTSGGGSTDSDADTDSNSGTESVAKNKFCGTSQSETCVYSVFTMLRVWDLCGRSSTTEPAPADATSFTPPPGLACPPGLSAPTGFAPKSPLAPSVPAAKQQTSKKNSSSKPQTLEDKLCKQPKSKKGRGDKLLKDDTTSKVAPWRRSPVEEEPPRTPQPKVTGTSPPWRRGKESVVSVEATSIAPPPGL